MQQNDLGIYQAAFARHDDRRLLEVLLSIRPLQGSRLHDTKIHLSNCYVQPCRPTGGAAVHCRIRGPDVTWRLGSMLPQLPTKLGTLQDSNYS